MAGSAPIYSIAAESQARAEAAAWARFSAASDSEEFCASWLAILCAQIDRVNGGLLLLGPDPQGAYTPAAVWPDASRNMQHLSPAAERTLKERRGIVVAPDGSSAPTRDQPAYVGYPIEVAGVLHGAVVLDIPPSPEQALQRALRLLHWASAWLVDQFRQRDLAERDSKLARLTLAIDLVATAVQEPHLTSSALAVANALAARLHCDRVSIGFEKSGRIEVRAISNTATFDPKTKLVRLIAEAMDEVLDLDATIVHPTCGDDETGAISHAALASELKDSAICSVPLVRDGHATGVLTLERSGGELFDPPTVELCETAGMLLGPILELKLENERGALQRMAQAISGGARSVFGPRHPGAKLIALMLAGVVLFCSMANGIYRVSAKTVIEGAVQRAVVAPFDGYVMHSLVRAGDIVKKGQTLVGLDDRDLKLEQMKLVSEREELLSKHRQAFAGQDRAGMTVVAAQINQVQAQLSLVEDKLLRTTLVAPFDGVVVSGDLSQLLGAPVEQGKLLFQIAPLDAYRVILEVDERDISHMQVGQRGELALTGIPNELVNFAVKQITPVSTAQEGRNYFRVEAQIGSDSTRLRPGMEGVGKIVVGDRRLIWIWTHSLVDWLRLWTWRWLS